MGAGGRAFKSPRPDQFYDGKIASKYDAVSGETVTYQYDSLNRLASASAGSTWGEAYTYDGFGNLTAKTVTAGSGPTLSVAPNPNTNHLGGEDANGNAPGYTYDVENRIIQVGNSNGIQYAYDAQNKRTWSWPGTLDTLNNRNAYTVYYYTPAGQKLGAYQFNIVQTSPTPTMYVTLMTSDRYFGGKRLAPQDRLGSAGDFYPWGEAKGGNNPPDTWSFATYWRDSASGLDYANNRYYSNSYGRFMTPDPSWRSIDRTSPQTWNRYAYVLSDPVNSNDPTGLAIDLNDGDGYCDPSIESCAPLGPDGFGGDPNAWWYQQVEKVTNMLDSLGNLVTWNFVNGNVNEVSIAFSWVGDLEQFLQVETDPGIGIGQPGTITLGEPFDTIIAALQKFLGKMQAFNCPPAIRVPTPLTQPDQFQNKRGTPCKVDTQTGEVWCKDDDLHGGEVHYSVYKDDKAYEKRRRDRTVWWNGCLREQY